MILSSQNVSNQKGGRMRATFSVLSVAVAAMFVGACAAHTARTVFVPTPTAVAADVDTIDVLPIRQFSLAEIVAPVVTANREEAPPSCDVAAIVAGTFTDSQLLDAPLTAGAKQYSYVEVRAGKETSFKDYEKDFALRVLDPATCTTEVVTLRKTYASRPLAVPVRTKTGTVTRELPRTVAVAKSPAGWDISVVQRKNGIAWNNWATTFQVNAPANRIVVGLKYVKVEKVVKGKPILTSVLYIPHSDELVTAAPGLIDHGIAYIKEQEQRVKDDLRARGVQSAAIPGMLLADAMERYAAAYPLQPLLPIEHTDMGEFILDPVWTVNRVYAIIGANREQFAANTCSPAAACGPQQFMPASYRMVRDRFPAAGLIRDVDEGRRDGFNSMKAAALLMDLQLKTLIEMRGDAILHDPNVGELQIAGYNTGASRSARVYGIALAKNILEWTEARGKRCSRVTKWSECLLTETKGYIAKYRYLTQQWPQERTLALDEQTP
ncbi:MAG: hypothetical protein IT406_00950 [Candidatus Yanofskybacteria bacterium]|nr:hypothetical protein [Candidatus Yanofskybacteria bacterium]